MSLLQYTSKEMYSSTELIRKSKMIFDKLNKQEIEKAIILRDGKPSFMLLDFDKYEEIMEEYIQLKEEQKKRKTAKKEEVFLKEKSNIEIKTTLNKEDSLNEKELEEALSKIDELEIELATNNLKEEIKDGKDESKSTALKEFWD